jgi:2-polyprenyl-3-methyl-5-hydroxy-6-metoxy-1,4-benzoquinol methylase
MGLNLKRSLASIVRRFGYDVVSRKERDRAIIADSISKLQLEDTFYDSAGYGHERLKGYRDLVAPNWRSMFLPPSDIRPSAKPAIDAAMRQAHSLRHLLGIHGFDFVGKDVLEVGCHDGKSSFAMAMLGARSVHAIDIPAYGVFQKSEGTPDASSLEQQSGNLQGLRKRYSEFLGNDIANVVRFSDLDIAELDEKDAYDLIVSWETLEHVTQPKRAFANIYGALRPGGLSFHEYNPFFGIDGGHSLCTLDFPYGHARLSADDFERYVQKYRPEEYGVAMNFYNHCLNRMTISDLRRHCSDAGFETLELSTWLEKGDLGAIDENTMMQCKKQKANVTLDDLLSPRIWILLRKPGK